MPPRVALIHAMRASIGPIEAAFARAWPEARLAHRLDDTLPADLERAGGVDAGMERRFAGLVREAVAEGADAILFTCSAFGRAIDAAAAETTLVVMKPNEAMVSEAVSYGEVALLATFAPTLASMRTEFEAEAARQGRPLVLRTVHVPGALAALAAGDAEGHDARVAAAAVGPFAGGPGGADPGAADRDDGARVVALAQFSMARAAPRVRAAISVPVLTTPDTAVAELRRRLGGRRATVPPRGPAR
jgi:aspartate/glutamate racemase